MARAWRMLKADSSKVAGIEDQSVTHPESLPVWDGMKRWRWLY